MTSEHTTSPNSQRMIDHMILLRRYLQTMDEDFVHDWTPQVIDQQCVCVRRDDYDTECGDTSL